MVTPANNNDEAALVGIDAAELSVEKQTVFPFLFLINEQMLLWQGWSLKIQILY